MEIQGELLLFSVPYLKKINNKVTGMVESLAIFELISFFEV